MENGASASPKPRQAPGVFMLLARLLLIVVIFAVVGPVVGTVVVAIVTGPIIDPPHWLTQIPFLVIIGLGTGAAFAVGGVPAVIAGGFIGIKHLWFRGAGWRFALGVGVLVGAWLEYLMHRSLILGEGELIGLFTAASALATLACWRIVKSWSFLREADP